MKYFIQKTWSRFRVESSHIIKTPVCTDFLKCSHATSLSERAFCIILSERAILSWASSWTAAFSVSRPPDLFGAVNAGGIIYVQDHYMWLGTKSPWPWRSFNTQKSSYRIWTMVHLDHANLAVSIPGMKNVGGR